MFLSFEQEIPLAINTSRIIKSDVFLDIFYGILRAYCRSFRITVINEGPWVDYLQKGGSVLLCGWHQQIFSDACIFWEISGIFPIPDDQPEQRR